MNSRTVLLLALLAIVAGGGLWLHQKQQTSAPAAALPAAPVASQAKAPDQPRHARIADDAAILGPFVPRLGRMADAFDKDLGIDVRVATSNDAASSIEEQATAMFEGQQIGRNAAVGGLLIILNPQLHSARIEVGYTLEGALTDLHMSKVAKDQLAPYASYGVAGMAVMDVLHYLRDHVYLSAALGRLNLPEDLRNTRAYLDYEQYVSGGAGARTALANSPSDLDFKKPVPPERRARYEPAKDVQDSVAAFLRASADLAGDPTLELDARVLPNGTFRGSTPARNASGLRAAAVRRARRLRGCNEQTPRARFRADPAASGRRLVAHRSGRDLEEPVLRLQR